MTENPDEAPSEKIPLLVGTVSIVVAGVAVLTWLQANMKKIDDRRAQTLADIEMILSRETPTTRLGTEDVYRFPDMSLYYDTEAESATIYLDHYMPGLTDTDGDGFGPEDNISPIALDDIAYRLGKASGRVK